jgi:hypothetical protein
MYDRIHIVDAGHKPDFQPYHLMSHSIIGIVIQTDIQETDAYGIQMFMGQVFVVGQNLHTNTVGFFHET